MPSQSITLRTIEVAKPSASGDVYTWDTGLRGFGLRVTPRGVKIYVLQFRVEGGPARRGAKPSESMAAHGHRRRPGAKPSVCSWWFGRASTRSNSNVS